MKKFLIPFGIVLLVFGGFAALNLAVVYCSGELNPYQEIASLQQAGECELYGPIFNNDHGSYKVALYSARDSDIVVTGSSRALQYRQDFFSKPMVNCGRAIASLRDAVEFMKRLGRNKRRQTIIIVADYWWFMKPLRPTTGGHQFTYSTGSERSVDMFFLPVWYAIEGKISLVKVFGQWLSRGGTSRLKRIGLRAISTDCGFTVDGAYRDIGRPSPTCESMRKSIRDRLGKGRFVPHPQLETTAVDQFFASVGQLRKKGDRVVVLFPPAPTELYKILRDDPGYAYAIKTADYARSLGAYDLTNPAHLDARCADFHDFVHTSPELDARALLRLRDIPELRGLLNISHLEKVASGQEPGTK